jgi:hypothetical protein
MLQVQPRSSGELYRNEMNVVVGKIEIDWGWGESRTTFICRDLACWSALGPIVASQIDRGSLL